MGRTVRFPTTDSAEVRDRDEQFVHAFVENGGKAKAQCSPKTVERAISQLVTQGLVEKELTSTTPPKAKIRWISI